MQNLKVQWCENKTAKTGKPYKKLSVEDEKGAKFDVNIFSNFPDFANIAPGSVIFGKLTQEGQYWNISVDGEKPRSGAGSSFKQAQIEKVMEVKNENIGKVMDRKEESIKLAGAQRDAVLIVTTLMDNAHQYLEEDIEKLIIKWRNWFLNDKEFNSPPPF